MCTLMQSRFGTIRHPYLYLLSLVPLPKNFFLAMPPLNGAETIRSIRLITAL